MTAVETASEIAEYLNGKEFAGATLACEYKLIPEKDLASVRNLKAVVVPHTFRSALNRGGKDREIELDLGIMKRANESEFEHLLTVVQAVGDAIEGKRFSCGVCMGVDYSPLYDVDAYLKNHVFLSVLNVRIKLF